MSILFENATVLIRDKDKYVPLENAYLGVENDKIDYLSNVKPEKKYDVIKDYSGKLLMSGLVNAHTHTPMVFLRGQGSNLPLEQWLYNVIFPIEGKLDAKIISIASYYALLEMIACGTTSFTDMYFFPEQTAQAVKDSGIKANINKYINCFDDNAIAADVYRDSIKFYQDYNNTCDGRLKVDFSIHAQYTNKKHVVKEYSELCKEANAIMHIHLSETKNETDNCIAQYGVTPTQWFKDLGTFENPVCAAHCVWVNDEDLQILKDSNATVMHNPTSNMILGSGFAPLKKMFDMKINVALGTDGAASNINLNMFEELHLARIIHDGYNNDPTTVNNTDLIDMATVNGYKMQQRFDCGLMKVGYKADIIAIDLQKIHNYPVFDYETIITTTVQGSDVCLNMVDGKILYEDGEYFTLDKDKIVAQFKKTVEEFYNK